MQEENMQEENSIQDQETSEWQAPPPPEKITEPEPAQMSEAATLGNIFFEPGSTFEDLRRKPRFIMALLIMIILLSFAASNASAQPKQQQCCNAGEVNNG